MPVYGSAPPVALEAGGASPVWSNETLTLPAGSKSVPVALRRNPNLPNCLSAEIEFAADPGAFAVEVQVADTDSDKYYVTKATLSTGLNATFVGRVEVLNLVARFARLQMVSRTNAVAVSAKFF